MAKSIDKALDQASEKLAQIGQMIKATRIAEGITQEALASRHGISRVTMIRVEEGRPGVNWLTVATICADLGLPLDPDSL